MNQESSYYTSAEVLSLLKCSKTAFHKLRTHDDFPEPLKFSFGGKQPSRTTTARYSKAEVHAWIRDKEIEARNGRQPYVSKYPTVQLCGTIDCDSAIFYLRALLDVYEERKRLLGTARSHLSHVAPEDLRWGEIKAALTEMLPQIMLAASAVGIDVEGMVKS
jgi:predicted DNA-binding transcriptional regulator AlpA